MRQRHILSYLQYIQWVILFLFLVGCQGETPLITINHPASGLLVPVEVDRYEAGDFEGDAQLARFVRERLDEQLAQRKTSPSDTPDGRGVERVFPMVRPVRAFVISGSVWPSREMGLDESFGETDRVKMAVAIVPTQSQGATRTIRFSYIANPDLHSVQMRSILSGWVDKIVNRIYRSDRKTETRLARGKSRYDQQGRKWVGKDEHRKALGAFLQAIDDRPSDSASLYNAGLVCEVLGEYRRALGFHQRARRLENHGDYNLAAKRVETILLSGQVAE